MSKEKDCKMLVFELGFFFFVLVSLDINSGQRRHLFYCLYSVKTHWGIGEEKTILFLRMVFVIAVINPVKILERFKKKKNSNRWSENMRAKADDARS